MKNNETAQPVAVYSSPPTRSKFNPGRYILGLILALLWLGYPQPVAGQDSSITARVNQTSISTDELVSLVVTVVDNSARQHRPLLPNLEGLTVVDLDLSTEVSLINGQLYTAVTYTYRLQPRRTGTITIPPVAVEIDELLLQAQPLTIEVTQGAPPAPTTGNDIAAPPEVRPPAELEGREFFVESVVDIPNPYIQQQIIHTFRFYQAIQLYKEPQYDEPLFTGFETAGLPVRQYNLEAAGRTYLVTEIRKMLFPKVAGRLTIPPARLVLLGNIYEEPVELYSGAATVEVQPLPEGAPPGFNGAVGQYSISAWFTPQVTGLGQPATFHVAVTGAGNISVLPEPTWPQLDNWQVYDTLSSLSTDITGDKALTGTRVFERLIVPGQTGEQTIPPASLVYFDPVAAAYKTVSTEPLSVQVTAAPTPTPAPPTAVALVPAATPAATPEFKLPALPDLSGVNRAILDSVTLPQNVTSLPAMAGLLLGMCGLLPLAALAGAGGLWLWQRRRQRPWVRSAPPVAEELGQPRQRIHPVLAAAMHTSSDNFKTVHRAFNVYLKNTLNLSLNGLTRTGLIHHLRRQGLAEGLVRDIDDCLAVCENGRFNPTATTGDDGWGLMVRADELLFALDRALGRD